MKRDANWTCYRSLNQREHAGKYVVIAQGTLIGSGLNLGKLLKEARKRFPKEVPFVAKVRDPRCLYTYSNRVGSG